jgi:hypothetical protein
MKRSGRYHLIHRILLILIPLVWLTLILSNHVGRDYYPLHWSAERLLAGESPYGVEATRQLSETWLAGYRAGGVAYPLPALLLVVPLTILPFSVAALLWTLIGALIALTCLNLTDLTEKSQAVIVLPFLFLPFFRGAYLGQATLLWFGLSVLLVLGIKHRYTALVGICIVLLMLKPQSGLIFALAGLVWSWRVDRRALLWAGSVSILLGGISWYMQPTWFWDWLAQVKTYTDVVHPTGILPWGLLLIPACWHLPWWARVAVLQVILFPIVEVYSLLPLLFVWIAIGGKMALWGAGLSWLYPFLVSSDDYRSLTAIWVLMLGPLIVIALLSRNGGSKWLSRLSQQMMVLYKTATRKKY